MYFRLLACLIFLFPLVLTFRKEKILFVSADCPACYYKLENLQKRGINPRLFAIDQSLEINCLLEKLHRIEPRAQQTFLKLLHNHPIKIELSKFCEEMQIDKNKLLECKNCSFFQLSVKEILFYVMSKFVSKIPYET